MNRRVQTITAVRHHVPDGPSIDLREDTVVSSASLKFNNTLSSTPLRRLPGRVFKRVLDILIALPIVVCALPVLCLTVKCLQHLQSQGPLFYRQVRCGRDNKPFTIYKFRTMHVPDAGSCEIENAKARIFPIGRLLRASKADEFPQFLNVLLGSMSVVGPRPHHFDDCEQFERVVHDYAQRTIAKPGITGLAQYTEYCGKFEWNCIESRVAGDLRYIREWKPIDDITIIFKTGNAVSKKILRGLMRLLTSRTPKLSPQLAKHTHPDMVVRHQEATVETPRDRKAA